MNTAEATVKWSHQHLSRYDWIEHYNASAGLVSRNVVIAALTSLGEFGSLIELGSHAGVMLRRVEEMFPQAILYGVEANKKAADSSPYETWNEDLMSFVTRRPRNFCDIVLTHYTLAYISPQDIPGVLSQCVRIARKAVVFAEPTGPSRLIWQYPEWQHDYPALLKKLGLNVTTYPVEGPDNLNLVTVGTR